MSAPVRTRPRRLLVFTTIVAAVAVAVIVAVVVVVAERDVALNPAPAPPEVEATAAPGLADARLLPNPDLAARQRHGQARPGPPPGLGEVLHVGEREAGRLVRSASATAPLLVVVADAAEAAEVALAARRTRDYHLVTPIAFGEGVSVAASVSELMASARVELASSAVATAWVAVGRGAGPVLNAIAAGEPATALVLLSPEVDDADRVALTSPRVLAVPTMVVHGEHDSAAAAVARPLLTNPLLRVTVIPGHGKDPGLRALPPRTISDVLGWLFAVTPPVE